MQSTLHTSSQSLHRWRLFRIGAPSPVFPAGEFTEVWDTTGQPYEETEPLPSGLKAEEIEEDSLEGLLTKVNKARVDLQVEAPSIWIESELAKPEPSDLILV